MKKLYKRATSKKNYYQQKDVNVNSNRNKKKRHCKIIWFNPPFSKSVKTNLGK